MSAVVLGLFFLACGWKFYKDFKCTRYLALKNAGHPQYFGGALCGALIFLICLCLDAAASNWGFYKAIADEIVGHIPSMSDTATRAATTKVSRVALWAIPVVWILTRLLNAPLHRSPSLLLAIAKKTRIIDELEEALYYCLDHDLMALITLKSKKIYVGIPKRHSPDPDRDRVWLAIWPVASGCRDEKGSLIFSTFYPDFEQLSKDTAGKRTRNDFQLVIPISEITSAQSFDLESFSKFSSEDDVLTKSPDRSGDAGLASVEGKEATESGERKNEPSESSAANHGRMARRAKYSKISSEIVNTKDKYHLRCYAYYVISLFLGAMVVAYKPLLSAGFFLVAGLSAVEAIKPIIVRLDGATLWRRLRKYYRVIGRAIGILKVQAKYVP